MYKLTNPVCASVCLIPRNCCEHSYCEMTIKYAKDEYNIELVKTEHKKLPLMGLHGCTAEPHLRPWCTVHACYINAYGFMPRDKEFTDKYFELREELNELEYLRVSKKNCEIS